MSRRDARSRRLQRRPSRVLPATIAAVVLVTLATLTAVAAIARLVTGRWTMQVLEPARTVAAATWGSGAVVTPAVVLGVVGLVMVVAGLKPGGYRSARLAVPDGGQIGDADYVISTRAVARLAAAAADTVDGVDNVSASASGRRVHLSVRTASEQTDQIRERIETVVTQRLEAAKLSPTPQVAANVRTRGL